MAPITQLPTEIISQIIQHLPLRRDLYTCALINHLFYIATNPLLWRTPRVVKRLSQHHVLTCLKFAQHTVGCHIRTIDFCHCHYWRDNDLLFLMRHAPHLQVLHMGIAHHITDFSLQQLPSHCPYLTSLTLISSKITEVSMDAFGQHCSQLTKLHLVLDRFPVSARFFSALTQCPLLKQLYISGLQCNDDDGGGGGKALILDLAALEGLTHLTVSSSSVFLGHRFLEHTGSWPHLTCLVLDLGYGLDDKLAVEFITSHSKLTMLQLNGKYDDGDDDDTSNNNNNSNNSNSSSSNQVTDRTLETVASNLPDIEILHLTYHPQLTSQGIRRLVERCTKLTYIEFTGCRIECADFKEAGTTCVDHESYMGYAKYLYCLNDDAIRKIRGEPLQDSRCCWTPTDKLSSSSSW